MRCAKKNFKFFKFLIQLRIGNYSGIITQLKNKQTFRREYTPKDTPMPKSRNWLWTVLFWLYLFAVLSNAIVFFNPQAPINIYYQILLGFTNIFLIPYLLNLLAILFDLLAVVAFYNFLNPSKHGIGEKSISPQSWKWFFIIRLSLVFVGHAYAFKEIQAILHDDRWVTLAVVNLMLLFYAPSYLASFLFIFQHKNSRP